MCLKNNQLRLMMSFDIKTPSGISVLKETQLNTPAVWITKSELTDADIEMIRVLTASFLAHIQENSKLRHLFQLQIPLTEGVESKSVYYREIPLDLEYECSRSKIYNSSDSRLYPHSHRESWINRGWISKARLRLRKIVYLLSFHFSKIRS